MTLASGTADLDPQGNHIVFADGGISGPGNLTIDDNNDTAVPPGGSLTLDGDNSISGTTTINAGMFIVNGSLSTSSVVVVGGTLSLGNGAAGMLQTGGLDLSSTSQYAVEIDGATAGQDYGQTLAAGSIDLNGATLVLSGTGASGNSSAIVLVRNPDNNAITGSFSGLPEGASVTVGGTSYQITYDYRGIYGDGPDVALVQSGAVVLDSSLSDSASVQGVEFLATVCGQTASGALPSGTVNFYDGATKLNASPIALSSTAQATFQVATLPAGTNHITAVYSGDGNFAPATSNVLSFTWTMPSSPALGALGLADATGAPNADGNPTTTDPTLCGTIAGSGDAIANVPVEFYLVDPTQAGAAPIGQTWSNADGQFTFLPKGLPESTTPITVWARTGVSQPVGGQAAYGPPSSCTFYYQTAAVPAVATLRLQTVDSTTGGIPAASNPTLTGTIGGADDLSGVTVCFTNSGSGTVLGYAQTDSNGNFTFSPTGLDVTAPVTIAAAACLWDDNVGAYQFGASQAIEFQPLAPTQPPATIESLWLVNPSDTSGSLPVTTDPTVAGQVACDTGVDGLTVEFGHYNSGNDWVVDGTATTDADGNFTYCPADLAPGGISLLARVRQWDYTARQYVEGPVSSPLAFTLQAQAVVQPAIGEFQALSANGILFGTLTGFADYSDVAVEFTIDGTASCQDRAAPQADGSFTFQPAALADGQHTAVATPVWWDAGQNEYVSGQSAPLTFTYAQSATAAPAIVDLGLANNVSDQATGPEATDPSVQGRVIAQGPLDGATVNLEFSTSGGTLEAQTTADSLGHFSCTPTGLPPGSVSVEARATLSDDGGQVPAGDWSAPFVYTLLADSAPTIASLALAHNLAPAGSPPHAADPTVTGRIALVVPPSGGNSLSGVTIQFEQGYDQNNDGTVSEAELESTTQGAIDGSGSTALVPVIVGTATTDADGNFTFTPTGLPAGKLVEVLARTEWTGAGSSIVYGDWQSCTFTLDAPAATSFQVVSLELNNDTGNSSTDGATADPTVRGQISGPGTLAGVIVEIDQNGDGLPEGTAATDSQGQFTYTPQDLPEGHVVIAARTADDGTQTPGDWLSLGFVYSSEPDGSDAQALVAAYRSVDAALNSTGEQRTASDDAYLGQTAANQAAEDAQTESAAAAQASSLSAAAETCSAALATARANYNSAVAAATATFQASGAVNYSPVDFSWPQAPDTNSGNLPPDSAQPQPPAAADYSGMTYNLAADTAYQNEINAAATIYANGAQQAQVALAQAGAYADAQYASDVNAAEAAANQAIAAAELAYAVAIAQTGAGDGVAAAYAGYQQLNSQELTAVAAAQAADAAVYQPLRDAADAQFAVQTNSLLAQYDSGGFGNLATDGVEAFYEYSLALENARMQCTLTKADATRRQAQADAAAKLHIDDAIYAAYKAYENAEAAVPLWQQTNLAQANYALAVAIAVALHGVPGANGQPDAPGLDQAIAEAGRARAGRLADAQQTYTTAVANAVAVLEQAQADAKLEAITAWNAASGTPWTAYQLALAQAEHQYRTDCTAQSLACAEAVADAAHDEAVTLAQDAKTEAANQGYAQYRREQTQAAALRHEQLGRRHGPVCAVDPKRRPGVRPAEGARPDGLQLRDHGRRQPGRRGGRRCGRGTALALEQRDAGHARPAHGPPERRRLRRRHGRDRRRRPELATLLHRHGGPGPRHPRLRLCRHRRQGGPGRRRYGRRRGLRGRLSRRGKNLRRQHGRALAEL